MCLAVPGRIEKIKNETATIDYGSEKREATILKDLEEEFKVGDFVIVQGKMVVQKVPKEQVEGWLQIVSSCDNES